MLFVGDLVNAVDPELVKKSGDIPSMVRSGIDRVLSMQTSSGGFAYWPGARTADDWGTTYATHMLMDAKDQGFDVPQQRLDDAIAYLENAVNRSTSRRRNRYRRHSEAYMHYVLARAGSGKRARIQTLIDGFPKQGLDGQQHEHLYLLMAALHLSGDRRYQKDLKRLNVADYTSARESRYSYYSDKRRWAFVLSVFHDLFKNDKKGEALARRVADALKENKSSRYYTTQEIMWGVTALGKWTQGSSKAFGTPTLKVGDKVAKPEFSMKNGSDRSWSIARLSEYPGVVVNVPNKKGKVYALISSEGVRSNSEPRTGGEGLTVARTFHDLQGNNLEPDAATLGDVVYVSVKITNTSGRDLSNLALVDRFAGAFEVENAALGRGTLPDWFDENTAWAVDHMNIRDDRIEAFGSLKRGQTKTIMYAARATSSGTFQAPPPEIEGMYEPEVWAREIPAIVGVSGPWDSLIK